MRVDSLGLRVWGVGLRITTSTAHRPGSAAGQSGATQFGSQLQETGAVFENGGERKHCVHKIRGERNVVGQFGWQLRERVEVVFSREETARPPRPPHTAAEEVRASRAPRSSVRSCDRGVVTFIKTSILQPCF